MRGPGDELEPTAVVPENPPFGESKCNGFVENVIKGILGQVRTIRFEFEEFTQRQLSANADIWQ